MPPWLRGTLVILAPIAIVVMIGLGFWQLGRLEARRATNAAILARRDLAPIDLNRDAVSDPVAVEYRQAIARGTYDPAGEIYWRNQEYDGAPGMHVVTPLRLEGGEAVLVDRGWLPLAGPTDVDAARFPPPTGVVDVTGLLRVPPVRTSTLSPYDPVPVGGAPALKAWFWLDPSQIAPQLGYALLPVVLTAEGEGPASLPLADTTLALDEGPHLGYAIQWFSFAAITTIGLFAYWRSSRPRAAR